MGVVEEVHLVEEEEEVVVEEVVVEEEEEEGEDAVEKVWNFTLPSSPDI